MAKISMQPPWTMPGNPTVAPNWISAINVFPIKSNGWRWQSARIASNANTLAAACLGASIVQIMAGTYRLFAGTAAGLYELVNANPGTWTDRSRGGGYTSGTNRWNFCQFSTVTGTDVTIANNYADAMQKSTTGAFSDLATAPKAQIVVASANALVAFNINDGTAKPAGIATSDVGDYTVWTSTASNEVFSTNILDTPGPITAAIAFQDGIVFCKPTATYFMQYVGGDVIWDIRLLSAEIGCVGKEAIIDIGGELRWVSDKGYVRFSGSTPQLYGTDFWSFYQTTVITSAARWELQFRPEDRQLWHWVSSTPTAQYAQVVNVDTGAWGSAKGHNGAITDVIEATVRISQAQKAGAFTTVWTGTTTTLVAFNSSHALIEVDYIGAVTVPNAAGTLLSGDIGETSRTMRLTRITPMWSVTPDYTDTTNNVVTVNGLRFPGQDVMATASKTLDSRSRFDVNVTGYFFSFILSSIYVAGAPPTLYAIDLNVVPGSEE